MQGEGGDRDAGFAGGALEGVDEGLVLRGLGEFGQKFLGDRGYRALGLRAGPVRLNTESGFDKWNSIRQAAC